MYLPWLSLLPVAFAASSQYIHLSADTTKCLTATSNADGAPVTISSCILSGNSASQNSSSGTKLQIWTCGTNNANQAWTVGGTSGSSISWTGKNFCMDLTNGLTVDGTVMQILSCTPSTPGQNQKFTLTTGPGSRWLDWAGNITGVPPKISIGAASEDHTDFNPNVQGVKAQFPAWTTTVPYPEASRVIVGPSFYQAARHLPPGTGVTWGVSFGGGNGNVTAVSLETQAIINAFASSDITSAGITLDNLELGNEADLYVNHGMRTQGYNIQHYAAQWIALATNLTNTARLANSRTRLWGGAFAESSHSSGGFSPQGVFANGILSSAPGAFITTISQHHYSGKFCFGNGAIMQDLMTKSTIRSNLTVFSPDIQAARAQGLDFVFGETNSFSCHGAPGVSNAVEAALWTLDDALYASQIGISQVYFHEGIGYKYNLIQPLTLTRSILDGSNTAAQPPHVQPQYYAAIIVAEAIGNSGATQVVELNINNARLAGYAFYERGTLKRAVFINSLAYLTSTSGARCSAHINLALNGGDAPTTFSLKRLVINHADDASGLT